MTRSSAPRNRIARDSARPAASPQADRKKQTQRAAQLIKHLSDPTRLTIVLMLADGEQHVGALCKAVGQTQPAVSHHLSLLRVGGVIEARRVGKNNFYTLTELGESLAEVVREIIP